ncbi:MAG: hypothetical protein QOE59_4121 [Actinomycetota bacterium]|nr:hypothetical protein [Actinomycetota bacterium]
MTEGTTPRIVPDTAAVPGLGAAVEAQDAASVRVAAYVGTPIVQPDGELFGTVVGLDPEPLPTADLAHEPLLDLLSSLLSSVLAADGAAVRTARELERAVSDAETDPLTGLLNRRGWERWIAREEERFRRFGDPASVVMMDLDGLKAVNDRQGHDAGDRFIRRTADTLAGAVRGGDPLARLGGDEFARRVGGDPRRPATRRPAAGGAARRRGSVLVRGRAVPGGRDLRGRDRRGRRCDVREQADPQAGGQRRAGRGRGPGRRSRHPPMIISASGRL